MKNIFCFLLAVAVLAPMLSGCTTYVRTGPRYAPPPPPYAGAVWVPGHYGPYGGWNPGHWRAAY